ncbi:SsrA-binding protein [Mycoplasmopsis mustelae]|uniref:SsrA-binding protein n=1 Tax=Mycoplasmopsis mustelae TaxID=171289 RepID=A0A4V3FNY2_9BACT|nr:SsrA-binding protein [Mycoplasmopsis mustelae]TDV24270.1 SsrA-binding protein [Mycoplasmopsis mustelae]
MKIIANNKKAYRDYEILDKYEAGIELLGWEVKTARANQITLDNAFCSIYKNEIYLKESFFKQYMQVKCEETRDRKLLMHKNEIRKLKHILDTQQITLIPLKLYFNQSSKLKLEIAIARGLKKYDKRDKIAKQEVEKRIAKTLKTYLGA